MYDESVWTKSNWNELKLPFPLLPAAAGENPQGFGLLSTAGPFEEGAYDPGAKDRCESEAKRPKSFNTFLRDQPHCMS